MLLTVDFRCNKVWTWDVDFGHATVETVHGSRLRFFATEDLLVAVWRDSDDKFKNIPSASSRSGHHAEVHPHWQARRNRSH